MDENTIPIAIQDLVRELSGVAITENQDTTETGPQLQEPEVSIAPIPENPPLYNESTSRFSSALWYQKVQEKDIILAGCGGIGSYVAFLLGRMKPHLLTLYDPDTVELANLSGQLFRMTDIGFYKVSAVSRLIRNTSENVNIYDLPSKFTRHSPSGKIMICGFDNMEARKIFFERWRQSTLPNSMERRAEFLFIDGRLAAEEFQVFAFTGDNLEAINRYEKNYLFSDDEADGVVCSYKQTSYMANMIASVMVNIFTNFCANECGLPFPREVPFLTSYRADFMDFKVER